IGAVFFFIPVGFGVRSWYPGHNPPIPFMVFLLCVILGAAVLVWLKEVRQSTAATKYTCTKCALQWATRQQDPWPTVQEARDQYPLGWPQGLKRSFVPPSPPPTPQRSPRRLWWGRGRPTCWYSTALLATVTDWL